MARVAHDVGILIDQEELLGLDAGLGIGECGAVPLSTGRVHGEGAGDVVKVAELALAVDDVQSMLGKAGRKGVAIGVGPGAETVGAALSQTADSTFLRMAGKSPASAVRSIPSAPG